MLTKFLLIGGGGFFGSVFRYALSGLAYRLYPQSTLPWGTLLVNVLGCFLIGFLSELAESRQLFTPEIRIFLFIGLLGGFTTFSTFGLETFNLLRDGQLFSSVLNIFLQIFLSLTAVWFGYVIARIL